MTRSVWTGSISFGLVNVPVKAYTAVRDHTVHFRQLEKGTGARIHHENVSGKTGEGVATRKYDGACCMIRAGAFYKRYTLQEGSRPPADFEAATEFDPVTRKQQGWVKSAVFGKSFRLTQGTDSFGDPQYTLEAR